MEFVHEGVKDVLLRKRRTQRKLATSMGVSKTTVQHWIVASTIRVNSNSLKPMLTEENKLARLLMANHFRDPNRNMSKLKGWTLQSSLLTLWMDENSSQQSNKNCWPG